MKYETLIQQKDAANENLTRFNAPYRIAFMTQKHDSDRSKRVTIEIGTPEQIERGCANNNLLNYATINEASKFMIGFNAALAMINVYTK